MPPSERRSASAGPVPLEAKATGDAHREVSQNELVHVADDLFQRPCRINDVAVCHRLHQRSVGLTLPCRFLEWDFLFPCLQHLGWSVEKDDQIRSGDKPPNQAQ